MKLREFIVREFRSIWDSGKIELDDRTTCLVGKNESGKTALLQALYRTNPIIKKDAVFDETYDYPKREVEDYRFAVENEKRQPAVVVDCLYPIVAKNTGIYCNSGTSVQRCEGMTQLSLESCVAVH